MGQGRASKAAAVINTNVGGHLDTAHMRPLAFFCLVFLAVSLTHGQETKPVSKKYNGFKEEFSVLITDKKIRHGGYRKYEGKDKLIAEGTYSNNQKVGEWKFYSTGELEQVYDFSSNELKYAKKETYPTTVEIDGKQQEVYLDTPPLYIGSKNQLNEELNKVMKYPDHARRMGVEGKVLAAIWIDENNNVFDIKIIQGIMKECDEEVISGLKKIEKYWRTGKINGMSVRSQYIVLVDFNLGYPNGSLSITVR